MPSYLLSILEQNGLITPEHIARINQQPLAENDSVINNIIRLGGVNEHDLAKCLAQYFNLPLIKPEQYPFISLCKQLGLRDLICRYEALPVAIKDQGLLVATSDPTLTQLEHDFRFATGMTVTLAISEHQAVTSAIQSLYGSSSREQEPLSREISQEELIDFANQHSGQIEETSPAYHDDSPVSLFIHQIIQNAANKGASDIHFEPYEDHYRIRFRCDGILYEAESPAPQLAMRIAARIKILARMDIAQKRLPQDGRIKYPLNKEKSIDLRVSTLPTQWGEKIVLRILGTCATHTETQQLGMNTSQISLFTEALNKPQGLILVTGPTGSGKTVTLYAGLRMLNTPERNISTAEDPIEINLSGINQVEINPKIEFGFAKALRTFLRQDPDVIMLGEVRDQETADIAVKAAQTGHLVLSTLHTNTASESIIRLSHMGIEAFNLSSSISLVIAQRLIRKLCPHCRQKEKLPQTILKRLQVSKEIQTYKAGAGCHHCNTGYLGRTGIYELLPFNTELCTLTATGATAAQLEDAARQCGMQTLQESAVEKLKAGVTSYAELQRVLYFSTS